MTFNVSQFAAKVNGTGLAKNNLFVANITPPLSVNLPIKNDLMFLCRSASIPGMDINVVEIKPQGWGKAEKRPTEFSKGGLTLTFMVDSNFAVSQFFHRWIQSIVNYNTLSGDISEDSAGKLPYEFEYKDNYVGDVEIIVYAENKDTNGYARTYTYKCMNAFPIAIGSIETAWENQAEIMVITVAFAYDSIAVSGMSETVISSRSTSPAIGQTTTGGALGGGISGATSSGPIPLINTSSLPQDIQDAVNIVTAPLNSAISSINSVANAATDLVSSLTRLF